MNSILLRRSFLFLNSTDRMRAGGFITIGSSFSVVPSRNDETWYLQLICAHDWHISLSVYALLLAVSPLRATHWGPITLCGAQRSRLGIPNIHRRQPRWGCRGRIPTNILVGGDINGNFPTNIRGGNVVEYELLCRCFRQLWTCRPKRMRL